MDDRAFASATELTNEIRDRRIGCVELLDFYLARAERHNPMLNAIVVWQVDQARERARAADAALARGERWGPLHGIPMTVKESFNVAGLPTTFGNPLWKDNIAAENAFLIDRLLQAGAIVFGKTNVPYMLADAQSYNDIYGTTNNPWDPTRSPGGSSGGEAATLAAGLSGLGAGSDIAGSLRNPAHYSGVYGHKPTWGLISTRGHAPPGIMTPTDISVVGPMARHAEDLDLALRTLAGPDLLQRASWRVELPPPRRRRLGEFRVAVWASSPLCPIDTSVSDLFDRAVDAIVRGGASVDDAARPGIGDEEHHRLFMLLLRAATASRMRDEDFSRQQEIAATLSEHEMSDRAAVARRDIAAPRLGPCQRDAHKAPVHMARIFQALRRVADTGGGDRRVPARPQSQSRRTHGRCQRQVSPVRGAVIFCRARQSVISAGNRSANWLERRGTTGGRTDHRGRG